MMMVEVEEMRRGGKGKGRRNDGEMTERKGKGWGGRGRISKILI